MITTKSHMVSAGDGFNVEDVGCVSCDDQAPPDALIIWKLMRGNDPEYPIAHKLEAVLARTDGADLPSRAQLVVERYVDTHDS